MPSERFYRLPETKKSVIRQAIMNEFARVPIDKVSINKIIKEAEISRGSFYTYFEDKWDILAYIFEDAQKSMEKFCMDNLEQHKGNVWDMLVDFLADALDSCAKNGTFEFLKNIMEHSRSEDIFGGFSDRMSGCDGSEELTEELEHWIFERADKEEFRFQSFEDFHCFLMIAMTLLGNGIRDFYKNRPAAKVKAEFAKKLELLRYGVCSRRQ